MKKYCMVVLVILLILGFGMYVSAADSRDTAYEAYGLCVVSKVMEYEPEFNMDKTVDADSYSRIMNFWFDTEKVSDINPTNADAVCALAEYAPNTTKSDYSITHFKDFGFVKHEHRDGYKIMCKAGFLNYESEFLKPNHPLTYGVFFGMLMQFEDEALFRNGFDVSEGMITDSYSEGQSIIIKQSTDKKNTEFKFSRMHSFYVHSGDDVSLYSYNVKRGQKAKVYVFDGNIVYVSIVDTVSDFDKSYDITNLRIYLCDPYGNQIIFINPKSGDYFAYVYDSKLMLFEGNKKITTNDINNYYIDRACYVISENGTNRLKYINITG